MVSGVGGILERLVMQITPASSLFLGADMNEGQLMGDFEMDSKQLEAQSWSQVVDGKFLRQQKKDVVKRQDVIYGERCDEIKTTWSPNFL